MSKMLDTKSNLVDRRSRVVEPISLQSWLSTLAGNSCRLPLLRSGCVSWKSRYPYYRLASSGKFRARMQGYFRQEPLVSAEGRGVLLLKGKKVHLVPRHSPGTRRIPPECTLLLVQSAASLQRFASGSDAASEQIISDAVWRQT